MPEEKTKECPNCAMDIDEKLDICPICGYEFAVTRKSKMVQIAIVVFLLAIFIFYFIF